MSEKENIPVILIVDDDELVRMTLSVLVSSLGYECLVVEDVREAIAIMAETHCDIVLSDIVMPNMDGFELLEHIKKNIPGVDVIITTGFSERAGYADVIKAGAIDFIRKPIDQMELEIKLKRAVREREYVKQLQELSCQDSLTSIPNKRNFYQRLKEEVGRGGRQNYPVFLAVIDVDDFGEYNEKFGREKGDEVLVNLAGTLEDCTRQNVDIIFRLKSDEFAVILLQTTADQATEIVQRILLQFIEQNYGKSTLSIGVVSCPRKPDQKLDEDVELILQRAKGALYEAKERGKNCVICHMT